FCFHPRDSTSDFLLIPGTRSLTGARSSHSLAPPGLAPTPGPRPSPSPALISPTGATGTLPCTTPTLLRSPTPRAPPGALCLYTVNSCKVDSPSRLSPRGQRNLTSTV
ncbi:hypothetical protein C0993_010508, partial [Termitomyces sp. T159_Od127]